MKINCPHCNEEIEIDAKTLASNLAKITTPKKAAASRENGKKGGRPKKKKE